MRPKKICKAFVVRLNDQAYPTFKEFSNTNIDSTCEILPKISIYNNEIARFVANIKYGISLNYAQLEVSEINHLAETF